MERFRFAVVASFMLCLAAAPTSFAGTVLYVDDSATGPVHDGSSWCSGYLYLQDALDAARVSGGAVTEIRVAQGTYKPDQGANQTPGNRSATFELVNGVALRGGYAGCGAADPGARDIDLYGTTLSGDLNGDDTPDESNCCDSRSDRGCADSECEVSVCFAQPQCCDSQWNELCATIATLVCPTVCGHDDDNTYHILFFSDPTGSAEIDGLQINGGNDRGSPNADCLGLALSGGGALRLVDGEVTIESCVLIGKVKSLGLIDSCSSAPLRLRNSRFVAGGDHGGLVLSGFGGIEVKACSFVGSKLLCAYRCPSLTRGNAIPS